LLDRVQSPALACTTSYNTRYLRDLAPITCPLYVAGSR
jgi:hypothetical protein